MGEIRNVKLELLRSGPANNQLLSPLTPYLALCGADGPVTVTIPFEHQQLLTRLDRLRYEIEGSEVAASQREAEVREIGEALGRVLSQVPGLLSELSSARGEQSELVHLRLSVGANELALVPFELAIGQDGYPGSGSPLFLQSIAPITLTREVRRGRPLPVRWNRRPKILFAFASPAELPAVPAQHHLQALRRAIDPWVKWKAKPAERVQEVTTHLTVLPNASLQAIRRACAETDYTHVHILAHGQLIERQGRYGLTLCADADGARPDLVDGEALATALTARDSMGAARSRPTVVSLATCDSGNAGSVITAGGSVAHALHAGGIPWVIASQFPLWMHASSVAAEVLYRGLLRGDDPRWVLYTLRQRLRTDSTATHDWASIVAYAVVPWDFERDVEAFRNLQTRQRIEVRFDEAEQRLGGHASIAEAEAAAAELPALYEAIRHDLVLWRKALPATAPPRERAERLGMSAASEKRIGDQHRKVKDWSQAEAAYEKATELYRAALEADAVNDWVITQYLSMLAVLRPDAHDVLAQEYGAWWSGARQIATWALRTATGEKKAWALGTLAELELLGAVYCGAIFDPDAAKKEIVKHCRDLVDAVGKDAFPVASTRRQFMRYLRIWPRESWNALAKHAIEALPEGASWVAGAHDPNG
jgi:hypothetical protein